MNKSLDTVIKDAKTKDFINQKISVKIDKLKPFDAKVKIFFNNKEIYTRLDNFDILFIGENKNGDEVILFRSNMDDVDFSDIAQIIIRIPLYIK